MKSFSLGVIDGHPFLSGISLQSYVQQLQNEIEQLRRRYVVVNLFLLEAAGA